jgi:hypothetical protein
MVYKFNGLNIKYGFNPDGIKKNKFHWAGWASKKTINQQTYLFDLGFCCFLRQILSFLTMAQTLGL